MKRILYDNQMFTFQRFGGVTRYFADRGILGVDACLFL